jgi:glucose/arabinose dehydrogenase
VPFIPPSICHRVKSSLPVALRILFVVVAGSIVSARAEVKLPVGFVREAVAGPEVREPMDLAFAPDNAVWITGRAGQIWRVDLTTLQRHLVGTIPTDTNGDRGLHGIAFHPDFPKNNTLFLFSHALERPAGKYRSRVSRWEIRGTGAAAMLVAGSDKTLIEFDGDEGAQHVGGGLLMHPKERLLYVTTGDNNVIWKLKEYCDDPANQAQSIGDLRGKVLRLNLDGTVPPGNPHTKTPGARGEVFTRGHRQPWLLNWDSVSGLLLLAENGGDELDDHEEINRITPGANFGWPRVFADGLATLTRTNHVDGFTAPWLMYKRNGGGSCTGALIYRAPKSGAAFPERYRGGLFYSDYNRKTVRFAPVDAKTLQPGATEPFAQGLPGGPISLRRGPDGALYLVEYGGWFQATTNDVVSRIVFKP